MIRLFRHYVPGWFLPLALLESFIFGASIYFGAFLRRVLDFGPALEFDDSGFIVGPFLPKAIVFAFVMAMCMFAVGLYQRNLREGIHGMELRIAISVLGGAIAMALIFYIFPSLFLGRGIMALAFASAMVGIVLVRVTAFKIADVESLKRRVLVVGVGDKALEIDQLEHSKEGSSFSVIGYVPIGDETVRVESRKVISPYTSLKNLAEHYRLDEIVIAATERRRALPIKDILDAKLSGIEILDLLGFFERYTGKISLENLQPSGLIFSDGFRQGFFHNAGKRIFDIVVSFILLLVSAPVMLLTASAILIESRGRGSIIYRQVRVGEGGRTFQLMKFRSMREHAETDGIPQWASKDDDRVTWVGKFIRRNRVDEIPQIYNVLKGDMSFVGPRPERPQFVEHLANEIPFYNERHRVKPGITGWAQICFPYGASEEDAYEKMQYDLYYVKNHSWFLDLMILMQTVEVVLWGKGAR